MNGSLIMLLLQCYLGQKDGAIARVPNCNVELIIYRISGPRWRLLPNPGPAIELLRIPYPNGVRFQMKTALITNLMRTSSSNMHHGEHVRWVKKRVCLFVCLFFFFFFFSFFFFLEKKSYPYPNPYPYYILIISLLYPYYILIISLLSGFGVAEINNTTIH